MRVCLGRQVLEVEPALVEMAAPRVDLRPFEDSSTVPSLTLRQGRLDGDAVPLGFGPEAEPGTYRLTQDELVVEVEVPSARFAEAAIKMGLATLAYRQSGLLLHASAVGFARGAFLALGPSGAGKSTLARWCVEAGGRLLSDESIVVFPERRIWGTPFRSDFEGPQGLVEAPLSALLTLAKGDEERLDPVAPAEAVQAILGQTYRPAPGELSAQALLQRATQLISEAGGMQQLTFRSHLDVGRFWAQRLG
jgi:hypothetical protein